jgi:hypothetical protein
MAHFAEINESNIVVNVLVTDDNMTNEGHDWLVENLGGTWVKTSYNTQGGKHLLGGTPLRKNYAGIGMVYDEVRDAFIPSKPFASWVLDEDTCLWNPPTPRPEEGDWYWDEDSIGWLQHEEVPE